VEHLLEGLKAVAEPTRLRLVALLSRAELTVSEITQILRQSQPRVSRHLKLLGEAGLLDRFPESAWVFYRLSHDGPGAELAQAVTKLVDFSDPVIADDLARLESIRKARAETAEAYFAANAKRWNEVRSEYMPEAAVETAVTRLLGGRRIGTLLDLGTGTGRMLELLAPLAERGIGIDQSHEMLTVARAALERGGHSHCQVRQGNILRLQAGLPGLVPQADAIIIHHVLHFLDDPGQAVRQSARMLKPGGRMLIVDFAPHERDELRERHAHRRLGFSDKEVGAWAEAAGLAVAATETLPPPKGAGAKQLTVCLWLLERPEAKTALEEAA
jgi:ubiquinone/menaquinone biosynthesis C-methylase UbiE/DNA-binding transcriptional ArsR family regulator